MRDDEKAEHKRKRPLDELDGEPEEESEVYEIDRNKRAIQIAIAVVGSVAIVVAMVLLATGKVKPITKASDIGIGTPYATSEQARSLMNNPSELNGKTLLFRGRFGGVDATSIDRIQIHFHPEGWGEGRMRVAYSRECPRPYLSFGDKIVMKIKVESSNVEVLEISKDD